jgi:hypothetical protein
MIHTNVNHVTVTWRVWNTARSYLECDVFGLTSGVPGLEIGESGSVYKVIMSSGSFVSPFIWTSLFDFTVKAPHGARYPISDQGSVYV